MNKHVSAPLVRIFIILSILLTAGICWIVYRNHTVPTSVTLADYPTFEGQLEYDFTHIGDLTPATSSSALDVSDSVTNLYTISGNGSQSNILEISGYAYIPGENIDLFNTTVLLQASGNNVSEPVLALRTFSTPSSTVTDSFGNGKFNYSYASFKSIIPKKYLTKDNQYQVLLLYGNNEYPKSIFKTTYTVYINDLNGVEVTNADV